MHVLETHPGLILKDELDSRALSAAKAALKMRIHAQKLHDIIRGERSITPDTALRLGRFFGMPAEFWMNLQTQYDLAVLRRQKGQQIENEVEAAA